MNIDLKLEPPGNTDLPNQASLSSELLHSNCKKTKVLQRQMQINKNCWLPGKGEHTQHTN